jgi:hypothetical protein
MIIIDVNRVLSVYDSTQPESPPSYWYCLAVRLTAVIECDERARSFVVA